MDSFALAKAKQIAQAKGVEVLQCTYLFYHKYCYNYYYYYYYYYYYDYYYYYYDIIIIIIIITIIINCLFIYQRPYHPPPCDCEDRTPTFHVPTQKWSWNVTSRVSSMVWPCALVLWREIPEQDK